MESAAPFRTFCDRGVHERIELLAVRFMPRLCGERLRGEDRRSRDRSRSAAITDRSAGGAPVSFVYMFSSAADVVKLMMKFHAPAILVLFRETARPLYFA